MEHQSNPLLVFAIYICEYRVAYQAQNGLKHAYIYEEHRVAYHFHQFLSVYKAYKILRIAYNQFIKR